MKNCLVSFLVFTLIGCGGVRVEVVESCIPKTSIVSTNDILFYIVKVGNKISYSGIKNSNKDDNYLCIHDKNDNLGDQCGDDFGEGFKSLKLNSGTKVTLEGSAVKTVNWGIYTIDAGPSPTTWFKASVGSDVIWVASSDILQMFESKSNFRKENQKAFNKLKLSLRMPPPLRYDSDGVTQESWETYYKIKDEQIDRWNCNL